MSCIDGRLPREVDEQTAYLITQLQLADAEFYSSSKGKSREGESSDKELAFQLHKQELENIVQYHLGKRMNQGFAYAIQTDGQILMETVSQERIGARDQDGMTEGVASSNVEHSETNSRAQLQRDDHLTELVALYISGPEGSKQVISGTQLDGRSDGDAESSNRADRRTVDPLSINCRCEACWEERKFFDVARVPCCHEYCRDCLEDLFRASMTDESLFPPRCCRQPIPIALVQSFLTFQLVQDFNKKKIEFETPNRTYCWLSTCAAFIGAQNICGEVASCLDCGSMTCTNCKEAAHAGDCPNDIALRQVLRTATEKEWQRCYSCWRLVELDNGCHHMTCRCGAQFCYVCGRRWKTCECNQGDKHHLLERANQIVDRESEPDSWATLRAPPDMPQPLAETQGSFHNGATNDTSRRPSNLTPVSTRSSSNLLMTSSGEVTFTSPMDVMPQGIFEPSISQDGVSSSMDPLPVLQWLLEVGNDQPESRIASPFSMEGLWPTAVDTNSSTDHSPSLAGSSLRTSIKAKVPQSGPNIRDPSALYPHGPEISGLYNGVPLVDRGHGSIEIDNTPREHPLYQKAVTGPDGLYHCPWEDQGSLCNHKPEKLKCNYDKFVDSHLKPYRCKVDACENMRFSSTACLLRHEREAHAMHGHGEKPFLCTFEGCERGTPGNGFPRHWNLCDHVKRVHNRSPSPPSGAKVPRRSRKRKNDTSETGVNKRCPATAPSAGEKPLAPVCVQSLNEQFHHCQQQLLQQLQDSGDGDTVADKLDNIEHLLKMMKDAVQQIESTHKPERTTG